jgi:hypothetical protein
MRGAIFAVFLVAASALYPQSNQPEAIARAKARVIPVGVPGGVGFRDTHTWMERQINN